MHNVKHFKSNPKIPEWEMEFRADRSSGPGGQNVNKTATKVTVRFNIGQSKTLTDEQKKIIRQKLANNITKEGEIVIYEQSSKSQWTNRVNVIRKLREIIEEALIPEKERRATKISKGAKERRLEEKKVRSKIKSIRREKIGSDW